MRGCFSMKCFILVKNHLSSLNICSRRPAMYKGDELASIDDKYIEKPLGGTINFAWFKFNLNPSGKSFKSIG